MTRHDAIKHLAYKIIYCKTEGNSWADGVNVDALEMATIALQKHELLKVIRNQFCPACGKDVIGSGWYCWNCGQHLQWEAEKHDEK
jgi:hypothetical protein